MQRHRGLDHAGDAGGGFGVTDLRFYRAECAPGLGRGTRLRCVWLSGGGLRRAGPRCSALKHFCQGREFRRITDLGAGAMRFEQTECVRRHAGRCVGALQRELLPAGPRRVNCAAAAIAGRTDALEHRVDAVAIAFGISQALQHQHADAFT